MKRSPPPLSLSLLVAGTAACAQSVTTPPAHPAVLTAAASYPAMAPVEQYRIADPQDEIAFARSAAPASISADADVLVLGSRAYDTAVKGKNGFVCLVERSWANDLEDGQFWNPKVRSPNCFNAPGVRSVLSRYLTVTEWVLAGVSKDEMIQRTKAALASHTFSDAEPGAMSFMMSPRGFLSDADDHWMPHVMFFLPRAAASLWGANLPASPIVAQEGTALDPNTVFFIPVRKWSDGSPGPDHHDHGK